MNKNKLILLISVVVLFSTLTFAQSNYRIYPSNVTQSEVFITKHPHNDNILFASANTLSFQPQFFISEGVYVTTNNGSSWFGSDTCKGANIFFHGGDPGIAVDKDGNFLLVRLDRTSPGLYSHYSTDNGDTWSVFNTITTDDLERATLSTDGDPSSPYYGRTYGSWVRFAPPYPVDFSFTSNGGVSWISPVQINNPSQRGAGGEIFVAKNGELHVCWAGVSSVSPFSEILVGYARSSDGGTNWITDENAYPMNGIKGVLTSKQNIRVNGLPRIAVDTSGGARDGWIYIVTSEKNLSPAGNDPDIILHRSTDNGQTWSNGIRVNQDGLNNGNIQYFPAIHVDSYGAVNIIYYDDRNTTSDSSDVFLSRSEDGGDNWSEFEISDHTFKPTPIGGLGQGYQGDNISLTSTGNILWPLWMDNSTGIYQVWTAPLDLTTVNVENNEPELPNEFSLKQNYPNPFNPNTKIEFNLPAVSNVDLKVFNSNGELIKELFSGLLNAGLHEFNFNAESAAGGLSSGVYFYRLSTEKFSETRSMILLK